MESISVEYLPIKLIHVVKKAQFNSYISDDNEQDTCNSHAHILSIKKYLNQEY